MRSISTVCNLPGHYHHHSCHARTPPHRRRRGAVSATATAAASDRKDVIVVGAGISGLVAAGRLAKEGLSVLLLEQNKTVGGRCQSVHLTAGTQAHDGTGSYRFDTGPSLLLFPDTYRRTYASLGQEMSKHVTIRRVEPAAYRVFFEKGGCLDMLYDVQQMVTQLEGVEAGAGMQYLSWLASARSALAAGMNAFIERDFDSPLDMLDLNKLVPLLPSLNIQEMLGQHHSRLALRFRDGRLRAMFTFQDLYVGLSPFNAPGAFSLLAATELTDGVWYPVGGFQTVRDSLQSIAEALGVEVRVGTRVDAISTSEDGRRVTGVVLQGGETIAANTVITNRDLPSAYELLRGGAQQYGQAQHVRTSQLDFSAGVIAFNWCISGRMLPGLLHHNVFLSSDYTASWQRATMPSNLCRSPNFYVHVPSRTDPSAVPDRCESVMVLLPVANLQQMKAAAVIAGPDGGSYAALVEAGREAVLAALCESGACTLGIEALRQSITRELVIDPDEWASRYGLQHGAAFGLSHGLDQLAAFRPALKDPKVSGLYFAGASTRPGNGVPLCMISADLVVQRVMQDIGRTRT